MRSKLTMDELAAFNKEGFLVLNSFYDLDNEIRPIQEAITRILQIVEAKNGLSLTHPETLQDFDGGYNRLIKHDRRLGGVVYDAVKQIPAFVRLVASEEHEALYQQIRNTKTTGIAAGGYGIRIDNPGEEQFRADWHQEYPAQLRSLDGLVFWSPLIPIEENMGPVKICVGSHADGLVPVHTVDPDNPEKSGAYALILENRDARIAKFQQKAPLTRPGDLIIMDFLTIHSSGLNLSNRSRWSMQSRLFNFREPTGQQIDWCGSFASGMDLKTIHPELIAN